MATLYSYLCKWCARALNYTYLYPVPGHRCQYCGKKNAGEVIKNQ